MSTRSTVDHETQLGGDCATCGSYTVRGNGFAVEYGLYEPDRVYLNTAIAPDGPVEVAIPIDLWPRIRAAIDKAVIECVTWSDQP